MMILSGAKIALYLGMEIPGGFIDRFLAFILHRLIRYRVDVVRANLKASFDYTDDRNLENDIRNYYRYLAKTIRQVMVRPSSKILQRRITMEVTPQLNTWLESGKSVIVTFGHTGNWEWTGSFLGMRYPDRVCALYKKISSDWADRFMLRRRRTHVNHLIEIGKMGELLRLIREKPVLLLMIADQNPGNDQGLHWVPFLNRKTAFVTGPENLALRLKLPVVYIRTAPTGMGCYHQTCEVIYDGEEQVESGEITRRFAERLEENIRAHRDIWLWSHKRWKRNLT